MINHSTSGRLKVFLKNIKKKPLALVKNAESITLIPIRQRSDNNFSKGVTINPGEQDDAVNLKKTDNPIKNIDLPEIITQKFVLQKRMNNDFEIFEMFGGSEKIAFANKELAKQALDSNKTHTECDQKVNVVYYFDASQRPCLIYQHRKFSSWRQYERPASHSEGWSKNVRIIIPIN